MRRGVGTVAIALGLTVLVALLAWFIDLAWWIYERTSAE